MVVVTAGYGTVPKQELGERRKEDKRILVLVAAVLTVALVAAVAIVQNLHRPVALLQQHGEAVNWIKEVDRYLSDSKFPTLQQLEDVPSPAADTKTVEPSKLDKLGVGIDHWPWEKPDAATSNIRKEDKVFKDIENNFKDTMHVNPLLSSNRMKKFDARRPKFMRTSSLEANLIGKSQDELPKRVGRLPIDTCSDDTPNCNKLRLETAINVEGWPWDKPAEEEEESAAEEGGEEDAAAAARPIFLRVAKGVSALKQEIKSQAEGIKALENKRVSAAREEALAQALQEDSFLMSQALGRQQQGVQSLAFGLNDGTVNCHRAIGNCNSSAAGANASEAVNASTGFRLIPQWYWLPKTYGQIEKNGVNVDSWPLPLDEMFGAVKWERRAGQQLKADASDMSWLADSDASHSKLGTKSPLSLAQRKAWEARLSQQLLSYADQLLHIQRLDQFDGCGCGGSTDEDKGPRCACSGQPVAANPNGEFSTSEVTSWGGEDS